MTIKWNIIITLLKQHFLFTLLLDIATSMINVKHHLEINTNIYNVSIFFLYCKNLKVNALITISTKQVDNSMRWSVSFFINWIRTSIGRNWLRVPINTTRKLANNSSSRKWSGSAARQYGNYSKASVCFWWIIWWSLNT